MWPKIGKDEIERAIENLQNINLLEIGDEKIALNSSMLGFVRDTIDDKSKYELVNTIAEFYGKRLMELYKVIAPANDYMNTAEEKQSRLSLSKFSIIKSRVSTASYRNVGFLMNNIKHSIMF